MRKGDKVRVLPPRGETRKGDPRLWRVRGLENVDDKRMAQLELIGAAEPEAQQVAVEDLVVVAEFRDYIYPGLVSTGKVVRGGDKPYHTVINGENFHALEALTFTHRGKIDLIYIDPPYNTGARDWKYNNDYIEGDDAYRHSKWLAFIERRLRVAKELLNPECSMLIVTIDEKELHRLGLLMEQVFPGQRIQMISNMINPKGAARGKEFYRVDEYIFYVYFGAAEISDERIPGLCVSKYDLTDGASNSDSTEVEEKNLPPVRWASLLRSGSGAQRENSQLKFYPIYIITNAVERIIQIAGREYGEIKDVSKSFLYSRLPERILFNTFSQEFFHKKFKDVSIDDRKCIKCKKCISACPVNMFDYSDGIVKMVRDKKECILCAECYHKCPVNAIKHPYIEVARKRLKDGYIELEKEQSAIYPASGQF